MRLAEIVVIEDTRFEKMSGKVFRDDVVDVDSILGLQERRSAIHVQVDGIQHASERHVRGIRPSGFAEEYSWVTLNPIVSR